MTSFLMPKLMAKFERDHPLRGRQMQVGWIKIRHFRRKTRYNTKTVKDRRILKSNRKSYVLYRMAMFPMTLLYQVWSKRWQITLKGGVVLLTWPIFCMHSCGVGNIFSWPLGELLSTMSRSTDARTTLEATHVARYSLGLNSIGSNCHRVCCKLDCITYR